MKRPGINNIFLLSAAFIATAAMLTALGPPIDLAPLAWVALVPFILVSSLYSKTRNLIIAAYLVSLCYWMGNLYWMVPVTSLGWGAFCLYTALLWPILVTGIRYCKSKNIPLFIAVPILVVGAERLQGLFLGGFYWRHLSHSQYANITIIQIADIFGAAGVSFLIAMVNGLIAELIIAYREKKLFKTACILKTAFVCMAVVAAVFYGRWRINQTGEFVEEGPLAASIQSNIPQSIKDTGSIETNEAIFNELLKNSQASAKAGAQLIIWPETMVPAILDKRILAVLQTTSYHVQLDKRLREHSKEAGYVLVGAPGGRAKIEDDFTISFAKRYNSAFLYLPDGTQSNRQYNKIHLVPFGEVVPFKNSSPWLHDLLIKFTPYDYDYTLDSGDEYTVFSIKPLNSRNITYKFSVLICYEDAIPKIARKFAIDKSGQKRIDWLVNISNDGWFTRFDKQNVRPSTELAQHTAICVFRAVENRLAILRSVNTGISCLIDTTGKIKNEFQDGNLPKKAMDRTGISGWFTDYMPIDKRVTLFSKYGQWLDIMCTIILILTITKSLWKPRFLKFKNGLRFLNEK